jgi:hypothetical protein
MNRRDLIPPPDFDPPSLWWRFVQGVLFGFALGWVSARLWYLP